MRHGLALFGHAPEEHVPIAVAAEQLGFSDLWVGEHMSVPMQQRVGLYHEADIIRDDTEVYDIWTICGAVLAATSTMTVAPGVLIAGLRHPVDTAVSAATCASIGADRFRLGIGAGWLEEEFELVGVDFASRFQRLEEIVEVLRLLARGGPAEFHGRHYDFPAVLTNRRPVRYPIVFGGLTPPAVRRAARLGDGWYGVPGLGVDRLQDIRESVKIERGGLDDFAFHVRLSAPFDDAEVETLLSLGFDHLIVPWEAMWSNTERRSLPLDGKLERLAAVAARLGLTG